MTESDTLDIQPSFMILKRFWAQWCCGGGGENIRVAIDEWSSWLYLSPELLYLREYPCTSSDLVHRTDKDQLGILTLSDWITSKLTSKIRTNFVSVWITSCNLTMLTWRNSIPNQYLYHVRCIYAMNMSCMGQCDIPFIRLISRIAVLGVPSSASKWISLSATISLVVLDLP